MKAKGRLAAAARARSAADACGHHRPVLAELAAQTSGSAVPPMDTTAERARDAARAHLEQCRSCRQETEALALVSFAVRRAWRLPDDLEPSPEAWTRLRARVARRGPRLGWSASSVAGLALGTALAVGLIVPIGSGMGAPLGVEERLVLGETGFHAVPPAAARTPDEHEEGVWLIRQSRERLVIAVEPEPDPKRLGPVEQGPVLPRREQMRYAEREPPGPQPEPAVPLMTIL